MARVLVAGATGFIGSHVVDHFLNAGHELRALVRPDSRRRAALAGKPVEIVSGDLLDPASLRSACRGREVVVNCAGSRLRFSLDRARRVLEFRPPYSFEQGWARTVAWLTRDPLRARDRDRRGLR